MRAVRIGSIVLGIAVLGIAFGQSWSQSYQAGIQAARAGHWLEARDDFKRAAVNRAGDVARPTLTPGSPTEPRKWRDGALYSPNFLAAYCSYRVALDIKDPEERARSFRGVAVDFEKLLAKGERSRDTYFLLDMIYTRLNDKAKREELSAKLNGRSGKINWKVDEEIVAPEEIAAMSVGSGNQASTPSKTVSAGSLSTQISATDLARTGAGQAFKPTIPLGDVPHMPGKYALVIGENGDQLGENALPFASFDAQTISDGLSNYAGYDAANVATVVNGNAAKIMEAAKALAANVPQDGVVLIYYAGPGTCMGGRDYLVGSESTTLNDPETMVAKSAIYNLFLQRGARVFAFFEVNRPIVNGCFFGSEVPQVGAISQMQATIPDANVSAVSSNGHPIGLFAQAFSQVLGELRSNRVPIYEFGWQLYNKMRRGTSGTGGGASHQIPTLPVLNNLAADARF